MQWNHTVFVIMLLRVCLSKRGTQTQRSYRGQDKTKERSQKRTINLLTNVVFLISKLIYLKKTVIIVDVYFSLYYITVFIPTWMPVVDHFNMKTWFYSLTQYKQCGVKSVWFYV